jgi:hypothetical protein
MNKEIYEKLQSISINSFCSLTHVARGRPTSEAAKAKISAHHKGKLVSEETRNKLSIAGKGRKHNSATCLRMRMGRAAYEARLRENPESNEAIKRAEMYKARSVQCKNKRPVRTPLGDYPSLKAAKEAHGFSSGNVIRLKIKKGVLGFCYI